MADTHGGGETGAAEALPRRDEVKSLKVGSKRGVLAAVVPHDDPLGRDRCLDELKGLAKTAGVEVVGELVQVRDKPHPGHCLGTGKLEELRDLAKSEKAEVIIFDNALSPSQGKAVEEKTGTVVIDRSEVILDIFASNARTYEAKLQVELAQLLYFRPRLKRLWTHLERVEGGVGAGRGPGEKQLETDRRLLDKRVSELKRKLREVEDRRERTVTSRDDELTVSLVGYTNAGKSTLMNALTGAGVLAEDKLFATLDTRTRAWPIAHFGEVLLSDTVGFVRDLPHHLVASFRSTLEEARQAALLLHVVDASNPEAERQIATVYEVLEDIGVDTGEVILVLNKADAAALDRVTLDLLLRDHPEAITVSAATGAGLDDLTAEVARRLGDGFVTATLEFPVGRGKLLGYLHRHAEKLAEEYVADDRVRLEARMTRRHADRLFSDVRYVDDEVDWQLTPAAVSPTATARADAIAS